MLDSIRRVITEVKQAENIKDITDCTKLVGYSNIYRIRISVSIRSTPYCISQNNIVTLHGGIIFLILRQEYEV